MYEPADVFLLDKVLECCFYFKISPTPNLQIRQENSKIALAQGNDMGVEPLSINQPVLFKSHLEMRFTILSDLDPVGLELEIKA